MTINTYLVFCLVLIAFSSLASAQVCWYRLRVRTGIMADAGTDSFVSLMLADNHQVYADVPHLQFWGGMGPDYKYLQRNRVAIFKIPAPCTNIPPCSLTLSLATDSTIQSNWFCQSVEVIDPPSGQHIQIFQVNQWVEMGINTTISNCRPSDDNKKSVLKTTAAI